VVFVTHDIGAAVEVADRIAVMYAGRIVEEGTVARADPLAAPSVHAGPAAQPRHGALARARGWRPSAARRRTCRRCRPAAPSPSRCRWPSDACRAAPPPVQLSPATGALHATEAAPPCHLARLTA
jgi:peptide/nickel transport system ATP-binding protein